MAKHNTILQRSAALLIDGFVLLPVAVIVFSLQNELLGNASSIYSSQVLIGLLSVIYFVVLNSVKGQTVGKKICGVKIVDISEGKITLYQAIMRILPAVFLLLGLVLIQASSTSPESSFNQLILIYGNKTLLILLALWSVVNFVVMTANTEDRAIPDYLAKTIVIKK